VTISTSSFPRPVQCNVRGLDVGGFVADTLLLFVSVPFACVGGIWALAFREIPLSISAAVGFITLFTLFTLFVLFVLFVLPALYRLVLRVSPAVRPGND